MQRMCSVMSMAEPKRILPVGYWRSGRIWVERLSVSQKSTGADSLDLRSYEIYTVCLLIPRFGTELSLKRG
jgi:hypothetical protein